MATWISGGSVAQNAGVKWADTIIEWDGHKIETADDLGSLLVAVQAGQKIRFRVLRAPKTVDLTAQF